MSDVYRKCQNCGTMNLNRDYCQQCGALINIQLKRQQERTKRMMQKKAAKAAQEPNKITRFFENAKTHPNLLVRSLAFFFYSIWVIVLAVGSFLAFVFGYIAA